MSTQNIVDNKNLSVNRAIAEYFSKESIEILKQKRFDVGCNYEKKYHRLMLYLHDYSCKDWCNIDEEQRKDIREEVLLRTIKKITDL